jgi:uncharacterized protein YdeI (YjbR/CyaY-like superfamily)
MDIGETFYTSGRNEWRKWLQKNHNLKKEIWLVYYRKATDKMRIPYNDAVEEALCFGWIDSTLKKLDDERLAQRFSPRRKDSQLSQANKERIDKLIAEGKMMQAGLDAVAHVYTPDKITQDSFVIPEDILGPLKANPQAWENFQKIPETYKRIRIAYIDTRRRHGREMFETSLRNFIVKTAQNKRIGFMKELE